MARSFRFPTVRSAAAALTVTMVAVSVLAAFLAPLARALLFSPLAVREDLALWQPVTYALVAASPGSVIFGGLILYSIGGSLEQAWGPVRLLRFAFGVPAGAALLTLALSFLWPALGLHSWPGSHVMSGALWVAYGLWYSRQQLSFWGVPVTGNVFALLGVGFVFLNAAYGGVGLVVPDAFAMALTWLLMRGWSPMNLWVRFRSWQLQRELGKRGVNLRVVEGGRKSDRDQYLN
jgi:membrane associated rhomboid family serine protease